MNCSHPRLKVTGKDEAFCYSCFNTVFTGSVPVGLQKPKNEPTRKYQQPVTRAGRRTSASAMEMDAAMRTVGR